MNEISKSKMVRKKITEVCQEGSYRATQFLNENLRKILTIKIIDNILVYTFYLLIILSCTYSSYQLIIEIWSHLFEGSKENEFPFMLTFSEHLFLYFLPIFILYGLLAFYQRGLRKYTDSFENPDPNKFEDSEVALRLSKKLFFTSVLSYITLKIVEILFFNFSKSENSLTKLVAIGIFFILLIVSISIHSNKNHYKE